MIAGLGHKFAVCLFALVLAGASTVGALKTRARRLTGPHTEE